MTERCLGVKSKGPEGSGIAGATGAEQLLTNSISYSNNYGSQDWTSLGHQQFFGELRLVDR